MAKDKVKKEETPKEEKKEVEEPKVLEETVQETSDVKGSIKARWKKFLEAYQVQNPVKYDIKEANGEFKTIPASFK